MNENLDVEVITLADITDRKAPPRQIQLFFIEKLLRKGNTQTDRN